MDQEAHLIPPADIEAPTPIMFWEPLEFTMAICFIGFGMIAHLMLLGVLAAVLVLYGARYLKRGAKRGAMQHFLWSMGLQLDASFNKCFVPSWKNDFVE